MSNKFMRVAPNQWINPNLITVAEFHPSPYPGDPDREATVRIRFVGATELKLYNNEAVIFANFMSAATQFDLLPDEATA